MTNVPLGRLAEHIESMSDDVRKRSAYRPASNNAFADFVVKTWSNRAAMLKAVEMSDRQALGSLFWKPCEK